MGRELSQCFLSDCGALRFYLWSKLCLSVLDCHTSPLTTITTPTITALHPLSLLPPVKGWKEYQILPRWQRPIIQHRGGKTGERAWPFMSALTQQSARKEPRRSTGSTFTLMSLAAARLAVALSSSVVFKGSSHQLFPAFVTIISTKTR